MCAGAVRRWLIAHDDLPDSPLVAQVPVSVRTDEQFGTYGNRILLMAAPLYTDLEDPVERLRSTHEALAEMKDRHRALGFLSIRALGVDYDVGVNEDLFGHTVRRAGFLPRRTV